MSTFYPKLRYKSDTSLAWFNAMINHCNNMLSNKHLDYDMIDYYLTEYYRYNMLREIELCYIEKDTNL